MCDETLKKSYLQINRRSIFAIVCCYNFDIQDFWTSFPFQVKLITSNVVYSVFSKDYVFGTHCMDFLCFQNLYLTIVLK